MNAGQATLSDWLFRGHNTQGYDDSGFFCFQPTAASPPPQVVDASIHITPAEVHPIRGGPGGQRTRCPGCCKGPPAGLGRRRITGQGQGAEGNGRGLDDGGRGRAVGEEQVEHPVELVDRREVDLEDEAVLPGDPVTLHDLRNTAGQLGDPRQLPGVRPDADVGPDRQPERRRLQLQPVPPDDSRSSRRRTRSATAGEDMPTRRPSSAMVSRGSRRSSSSSRRLTASISSRERRKQRRFFPLILEAFSPFRLRKAMEYRWFSFVGSRGLKISEEPR